MDMVGRGKFISVSYSSENQYHDFSQSRVFLERSGRTRKAGPSSSCGEKDAQKPTNRAVGNKNTCFLPFSLLQRTHNFTLPSWATEDAMTKLKELSELSLLSTYGIHKQKEKSRLQGGKYISKREQSNWICVA